MILIVGVVILIVLGAFLWFNRAGLHVAKASRAYQRGDEATMLESFAKAEALDGLGAEATAGFAYQLLKKGQTEEASALLQRALSKGRRGRVLKTSERNLILTYQALCLWKEGRPTEAIELLEDLLSSGYRTASVYGNLGFFLLEQGNLARAEEVCVEAADWDDDGKVILDNLGALRLEQKDYPAAEAVYEKLMPLGPGFPEAWWNAGRLALATGDAAEARRCWERALSLPFSALTTVTRGQIEAALRAVV